MQQIDNNIERMPELFEGTDVTEQMNDVLMDYVEARGEFPKEVERTFYKTKRAARKARRKAQRKAKKESRRRNRK